MALLLSPACRILGPMRISLKFGVIAIVFLGAAAVPSVLMVRSQNARIYNATHEHLGVQFFKPLFALAKHVSLHRLALSSGADAKAADEVEGRRALEAQVDLDLDQLAKVGMTVDAALGTREASRVLRERWQAALSEAGPPRQAKAHDLLLEEIGKLESEVVDSSLLIADPEVTSF